MSTHLSRKELKQDNVALKVEETVHYAAAHKSQIWKIGGAAAAVVVIGLISWFFVTSRADARAQQLGAALELQNAPVGVAPTNGGVSFPTEATKSDAIAKALNSVISENGGSEEAYAAEYYLAGEDVSKGKLDDAMKKYDHVASSAGADYASMAKLSKAQLLFATNKSSDAQSILKDLIANPTAMVSKDQATVALARGISASQPDEARKLLLPLASSKKTDVSAAAVAAMATLPPAK